MCNFKRFCWAIFLPIIANVVDARIIEKDIKQAMGEVYVQPFEFKPQFLEFASESTHSFDILHYRLDLYFPMTSGYLGGSSRINAKSMENGLDSISLDFVSLTAESVKVNGSIVSYNASAGKLNIDLGQSFNTGDSFVVDVFYHGSPTAGYYYYSSYSWMPDTTAYTFTEPQGSRYWFPCFDEPWDKANNGCEINATVPLGFVVASNGLLVGVDTVSNQVTYHWKETHSITTYLMSVAISKFASFSDWYCPGGDSIEVKYYMYREDSAQAHVAFANVVDMMDFFSTKFCAYPFCKYGMAAIYPFGGGMEHQTMTTIARYVIIGSLEELIAHELAHMWWGDMITCVDWKNIWINEGFATYSEALYKEYKYGEQAFRDRMAYYAGQYFSEDSTNRFPIYDPPSGHLFNWGIIYCKGAWVLHMLRYVVGDSAFWNIFPNYANAFKYGNANVNDFKDICETVCGLPLDWFFQQWIYDKGHPEYAVTWGYQLITVDTFRVLLDIQQQQSNAPIFKMPVELTVETANDTIIHTVWDSLSNQHFEFIVVGQPINLVFDKDYHILATHSLIGVEETAYNLPLTAKLEIYPNPFTRKAVIELNVGAGLAPTLQLQIYDLGGRLVCSFPIPNSQPPITEVIWNAENLAGGVYFVKLVSEDYILTEKLILINLGGAR